MKYQNFYKVARLVLLAVVVSLIVLTLVYGLILPGHLATVSWNG